MPAKLQLPSVLSKPFRGVRLGANSVKKPLGVLLLVALVAAAAWAHSTLAASSSPTTSSALAPALKLATGTLKLEGTDQAVDAQAAAKLLPLWELLEQLDTSGSAAPEEITAVVDEIQLNMTAAQVKAIDAMNIDPKQPGVAGSAPTSATASSTKSSAQVTSAGGDPMMGGIAGSGMPMDGGGPMPSSGSQTTASTTKTSSATPSSMLIKQVIHLLQSKVQS